MSDGGVSDELEEVENELISKNDEEETQESLEEAKKSEKNDESDTLKSDSSIAVFTQALTLTFLAEWGDRSQIATIALAASKDPMGVIFGGLLGHALCTGIAVIGGRMLAARISERTVAIVGGVLFIFFALHSFIVGPDSE